MNASKENAALALRAFDDLALEDTATSKEDDARETSNLMIIKDFLLAAQRKLPSEASYTKDKKRPKKRKMKPDPV
jgi:hypothetical protein